MHYPIKLLDFQDGLILYVPDPELVRSTYENLRNNDETTAFPYWAKVWPSAKAMALFLKNHPHFIESKRVLEIGAGIGFPSFLIAHLASDVIVSDYDTEAVDLIEKNIQHLGIQHVKAMCLDWNNFPGNLNADTIVLSDINYDPVQFGPLLVLIKKFLMQGSTILISTPQRITTAPFADALQPFIKETLLQVVKTINQDIDIHILILRN